MVDKTSPPSRAAWIEIETVTALKAERERRRLHGRRGLKSLRAEARAGPEPSPPSRAAWIEIKNAVKARKFKRVAAFTGGVD